MKFGWIDERPFNYLDNDGELTGCDVSLAKAAFTRLGVSFEPVRTTFAELLPGLTDGRWEVTTGMFTTPSRRERASFTRPIWSLRDGILVRPAEVPEIHGYRSLATAGIRLGVLRDQVQAQNAITNGVDPRNLVEYADYHDAAASVLLGEIGGYASVALAHREHLRHSPGTNLVAVTVPDDEVIPSRGGFACATARIAAELDEVLDVLLCEGDVEEPSSDPTSWPRG